MKNENEQRVNLEAFFPEYTSIFHISGKKRLTGLITEQTKHPHFWSILIPFCCCCNYATVGHIGIRLFNFVVLSVITVPHNLPTPHIGKTHLPNVSLRVCKLELNWCSIDQSSKIGRSSCVGVEAQLPPSSLKALRFIKQSSFSS